MALSGPTVPARSSALVSSSDSSCRFFFFFFRSRRLFEFLEHPFSNLRWLYQDRRFQLAVRLWSLLQILLAVFSFFFFALADFLNFWNILFRTFDGFIRTDVSSSQFGFGLFFRFFLPFFLFFFSLSPTF